MYNKHFCHIQNTGESRIFKARLPAISSLYVACQNRERDLEEFSTEVNHGHPPSLLIYGEMHSTDKSNTITIFEKLVKTSSFKPDNQCQDKQCQAGVPKGSTNFGQYYVNDFTAYLFNKYRQSTLNLVDIVFDIYLDHSIKNSTRNKRGSGKQIKVAGDTLISRHWKSFPRVNEKKMQLFQLLAAERVQQANFKQLVATKDTVIITNIASYLPSQLTPCNHEEADTRIFVHGKELTLKSHKLVLVDTVDTNVVVIAISCFNELSQFGLEKL